MTMADYSGGWCVRFDDSVKARLMPIARAERREPAQVLRMLVDRVLFEQQLAESKARQDSAAS
jgi:predicted transcriptional regulator